MYLFVKIESLLLYITKYQIGFIRKYTMRYIGYITIKLVQYELKGYNKFY